MNDEQDTTTQEEMEHRAKIIRSIMEENAHDQIRKHDTPLTIVFIAVIIAQALTFITVIAGLIALLKYIFS